MQLNKEKIKLIAQHHIERTGWVNQIGSVEKVISELAPDIEAVFGEAGSNTSDVVERELKALRRSKEFYEIRMNELLQCQKELPEPYRTEICNILANGGRKAGLK